MVDYDWPEFKGLKLPKPLQWIFLLLVPVGLIFIVLIEAFYAHHD